MGLELGIEVDLVIGWVNEAVKPFARVHVESVYFDDESVLRGQVVEKERFPVELARIDCHSIELGLDELFRDCVNKG